MYGPSGLACGIKQISSNTNWKSKQNPYNQKQSPTDEENERVRKHSGGNGSNASFFVIFLSKNNDNGIIGHHWSDDICTRISDAVS